MGGRDPPGASVEGYFGHREAERLIAETRSLQFVPGTRYSYANQNFRILSDILEERTGRDFGELLRGRLFAPAGMSGAFVAADTWAMLDGTEGYEGNPAGGFRAAENRIVWTGDAGLGASLDDMIAWERFIDATHDMPTALYPRLAASVAFDDGAPAAYGFGLLRETLAGRLVIGHGGALRGWRSYRLYVPSERLSIVVMFNHMADPHAATLDLLAAALGEAPPRPDPLLALPRWLGAYLEPETGLVICIGPGEAGQVLLRYRHSAEILDTRHNGTAGDEDVRLRLAGGDLCMDRPHENRSSRLSPAAGTPTPDITGVYRCDELDAEVTVMDAGGTLYGGFSGPLGDGRMEALDPVGADLWVLPCPRALDHTPPGDWTLRIRGDGNARVAEVKVEVGCWLARRLSYRRIV